MALPEALVVYLRVCPEATALLSSAGQVLFANAAARDALGLADEQPRDQTLAALVDLPANALREYLRLSARSPDLTPGAFAVQRRASEPVAYSCSAGLVVRKSDASPSILVLRFWPRRDANPFLLLNQELAELNDEVTRRRDAEEALRRSEAALRERAIEAENASRLKDASLATLSHELRTPLNAVLGWTSMLRQGQLDTERSARALETIERNARAQALLIEELLDVSRIITGKLRLDVQQLDPIHVVEAALDAVQPAAEAKGVRLQPVLDPLAGPILGDPDRLQQIVWNLLSNAVKFTPKGGRVQIVLERVDSSVEFTVIDSGQGIAPAFLPYVFERFRQQEGSTTRAHGGLGLGLAIAKNLAELHGGTIRVQSEGEGRGATFVVRLPRALVRTAPGARPFATPVLPLRNGADCPAAIDGLHVVVVDDESDALELLVLLLERCGAHVRPAHTAAEAYALVTSTRPDVLISDIGMPGEDGYALIRKVRGLPREGGGRTPAIALTAFARTEDRTRALTAGFQSHVPKPVEPAELLAVIASLVGRDPPP